MKTQFITPDRLNEFKVMNFFLDGNSGVPNVMDTVIAGLKWHRGLVYFEDFVVFAHSFEENLAWLESVLEEIQASGLELKFENCQFAEKKPKLLGYVATANGVFPDKPKTGAIANVPRPKDQKAVRRFLALCRS